MKTTLYFLFTILFSINCLANDVFDTFNHKIGGILESWSYEEPGLMEDSGVLFGLEYEMRNVVFNSLYYQLNAEYMTGETDYDGGDINTGSALAFSQTNTISMVQFYLGTPFDLGGTTLIPKIGFLYRKLVDKDDAFSGDYQRDQTYTVIPIGADFVVDTQNGGKLILGAWFSANFSGKNKTYLTDVGGDQDLTFKQDDGSGYEMSITYAQSRWYIAGLLRGWNVDNSEIKYATVPSIDTDPTGFLEPKNETFALSIRGGLTF